MPVELSIIESVTELETTVVEIVLESASAPGPAGPGVPAGGTAGQILTKDSGTDYDTSWQDDSGSGAPADVDYLVGTASAELSAEIVVGTSPGGELGGTWASPTVDATHSGSSHAAVQAAAEATAAAALSSHETDTTSVHGIADTTVLVTTTTFNDHSARHENGGADEISIAGLDGTPTELTNHLNDATDAHDASAISVLDTGTFYTATDVEGVLAEIAPQLGGSASGELLERDIAQTGHGLSVGDVVRFDGADFVEAQANSAANAEVVGIVSAVADVDNFTLHYGGRITGLSGLSAGSVYFLDDDTAGLLTTAEPADTGDVSKPLLIADSTTSGYFFNWRGAVVTGAASSAWTNAFNASGASLTGFVQDSGSWSVVSNAFHVDTTGGSIARLRWDTPASDYMTVFCLQADIKMSSAGVGSDAPAGVLWGWTGTGSGGYTAEMIKSGAGAGTKQARTEYDASSGNLGAFTPNPTWAFDAYHNWAVIVHGSMVSVYLDGAMIAQSQFTANQGFTAVRYVGLVCNNAVVDFQNFRLDYLALPS